MLENWEVFLSHSKFLDEALKFLRVWRLNNTRGQNRDPIILREWARLFSTPCESGPVQPLQLTSLTLMATSFGFWSYYLYFLIFF